MVYEPCANQGNPCTIGDPNKLQKVWGDLTIGAKEAIQAKKPAWKDEVGLSGTPLFQNPWGEYKI